METQQAIDTRNESYHDIQPTLNASRERVYRVIKNHFNGLTNSEIASKLGVSINTITPRVLELRKMSLVVDAGTRECTHTHRRCHIWKENYGITKT